jgi:hypothetical protein
MKTRGRLVFKQVNDDGSATRSAGKRQHSGEAGQQIDGAAKRAPLRRYVQFELHFIERSAEVGGLDGLEDSRSHSSQMISTEIIPLERQQESAAFWSTKIRMRRMYSRGFTYSIMLVRGGAPLVTRSQARLRGHELPRQLRCQSLQRARSKEGGSFFNIRHNIGVNIVVLPSRSNGGADTAFAFQQAENDSLALILSLHVALRMTVHVLDLPPTKISSSSTLLESLVPSSPCIAKRTQCSINQVVF